MKNTFCFVVVVFFLFFALFSQSYNNDISFLKNYSFAEITQKTFPLQKLKRGMSLNGYTRLANNKLVRFEAKVLSISQGKENYGKKIMIEIVSKPFQELGVMQGMSGSPLYCENKVVGALAYTIDFLKKPIAYVTPISDMLKMIEFYQKLENTNLADSFRFDLLPQQQEHSFTKAYADLSTIDLHADNEFFPVA